MGYTVVTKEDEEAASRGVPAWLAAHRRYKKMKWYKRISRKKLAMMSLGAGIGVSVLAYALTRDLSGFREYLGVAGMFIP